MRFRSASPDRQRPLRRFLQARHCAGEPTETDIRMMERALELAERASAEGEAPIGAVVYETESGNVLGVGWNTREQDDDPVAHAEIVAIREAARATGDWRLNHCTLVVTLEPCIMCSGAIVNARVGRVVYGCDDPKAGGVRSLYRLLEDQRLNHRLTPIRGVLASRCSRILREFFRARRRKPKV